MRSLRKPPAAGPVVATEAVATSYGDLRHDRWHIVARKTLVLSLWLPTMPEQDYSRFVKGLYSPSTTIVVQRCINGIWVAYGKLAA